MHFEFLTGLGRKSGSICIGESYSLGMGKFHLCIELNERFRHVAIFGSTGTGKSTLLANMMLQDTLDGMGYCFVDPKGDLASYLIKALGKMNIRFCLIDPSNPNTEKFNIFDVHESRTFKDTLVSNLVEIMRQQTVFWGERFGRMFEAILRIILEYNERVPKSKQLTVVDLYKFLLKKERIEDFLRFVENDLLKEYVIEMFKIKGEEQSREALLRRLNDWIHNRLVRRVIACKVSNFGFRTTVESGRIVVVRIPKGEIGKAAAQLIGTIVFTFLWSAIKERVCIEEHRRRPYFLYVDEFHNFAFEKSFFDEVLSESRGYRLGIVVATQYPSQLSRNVKESVYSNCSTFVTLNIQNPYDAKILAEKYPEITANEILSLSKYWAIVRTYINGKPKTYKVKLYPPFKLLTKLNTQDSLF